MFITHILFRSKMMKLCTNAPSGVPLVVMSIWFVLSISLQNFRESSSYFLHVQVCENKLLPDLDVDSVIYFENMGAYKRQMASTFNGFPKAKLEFYIEEKRLWANFLIVKLIAKIVKFSREEVKDTLSTKTQCSVFWSGYTIDAENVHNWLEAMNKWKSVLFLS